MGPGTDSASDSAQADLDELVSAASRFAREKLHRHGDFFPFGAAIKRDGGVKLVATQTMVPEDEIPDSADLMALCRAALARKRGQLRAAAMISHSTSAQRAIRIEVEHSSGLALVVMVPYQRRRFVHTVSLGSPVTERSSAQIWA